MAKTLDAAVSAELIKDNHGFLVVFEIEDVDGPGLDYRFTSIDGVTFGGNAYESIALSSSTLVEDMRLHVPRLTITVANVARTLRAKLTPVDKLRRKRITRRILVTDGVGGAYKTESEIDFVGRLLATEDVDEETLTLVAEGLIGGLGIQVPNQRTALWCSWRYQDGDNCTATGSDPECNRLFSDCITKNAGATSNEREFGGFRNVAGALSGTSVGLVNVGPSGHRPASVTRPAPGQTVSDHFIAETDLASAAVRVPIIFGRKLYAGRLIERILGNYPVPDHLPHLRLSWHLLSHGEIDSVRNYYHEDGLGNLAVDPTSQRRVLGFYYRTGVDGIDTLETAYSTVVRQLPQNKDSIGRSKQTFHRRAYVLLIQPVSDDFEELSSVRFDTKGLLLQQYFANGNPNGSPIFSDSPILQAYRVLLDADFGLGKQIDNLTDIDFAVSNTTHGVCATLIDSTEANTTVAEAAPVASDVYELETNSGFVPGMAVKFKGTIDDTVSFVQGRRKVVLSTARVQVVGDTLRARVPRFMSNIVIEQPATPLQILSALLITCRGFVSYAGGKIQFRVEEPVATTATFKDVGYAAGYGIYSRPRFKWLAPDSSRNDTNQVILEIDNDSGQIGRDVVRATDWDHVQDNQLEIEEIPAPAINTRDQGQRIADTILAKRRFGPGAAFTVGPIGVAVQPGDAIEVTHELPLWTDEKVRVFRKETFGLGGDDELMCRLHVEEYDATIYQDLAEPPTLDPGREAPTITLTISRTAAAGIGLSWTVDDQVPFDILHFTVHRDTVDDFTPTELNRVGKTRNLSFNYIPRNTELEGRALLFFRVVARLPQNNSATSNTVATVPDELDPTDFVRISPYNWVFGGGFDDPGAWMLTESATIIATKANAYTAIGAEADNDFTDTALAYDGLQKTSSPAVFSKNGGIQTCGGIWSFPSQATVEGRLKIFTSVLPDAGDPGGGTAKYYFSTDGGSSYSPAFLTLTNTGADLYFSPGLGPVSNLDQVRIKVIGEPTQERVTTAGEVRMNEIDFEDLAPPYSIIGGGTLTLVGDGTNYAECRRPWPGFGAKPQTFVQADEALVIRIAAVHFGTAPTFDLEVLLYDNLTATELELMTVAAADIDQTTAWKAAHYAAVFVPAADISGQLEIIVRTKEPNGIKCDHLATFAGRQIHRFTPHVEETDQVEDKTNPTEITFKRGAWIMKTADPERSEVRRSVA